jgi:hypothetical protein
MGCGATEATEPEASHHLCRRGVLFATCSHAPAWPWSVPPAVTLEAITCAQSTSVACMIISAYGWNWRLEALWKQEGPKSFKLSIRRKRRESRLAATFSEILSPKLVGEERLGSSSVVENTREFPPVPVRVPPCHG